MGIGKKSKTLIRSVAQMNEADYSKEPVLGEIYNRLMSNRADFELVLDKDLKAVMQISSLDLALEQHTKHMVELASGVSSATKIIHSASADMTSVTGRVVDQHEELTHTIIDASAETNDVFGKIEDGQKELTAIRELSADTIKMSKEMQSDMDALLDVIKHMNEVISGIDAVSSQTNLLALNASIEAARAGEAGRGFAVVAEEIRELAEQTQKLTSNMGEFVEGIRGASEKSIASAKNTIDALGTMTDKIGNVWELNEQNQKNVSEINGAISSLAAVSEEISSSMAEIESGIGNIAEQCEILDNDMLDMSQVIEQLQDVTSPVIEIEQTLDDAAKIMGRMAEDAFLALENQEYIKYIDNAIAAHMNWLVNLEKIVRTHMIMPLQLNATKCGFGHFYYAIKVHNPEVKDIWSGLEEKHKHFHNYGAQAVQALFDEDYSRAEAIYNEAKSYSEGLLSDLEKVKELLSV